MESSSLSKVSLQLDWYSHVCCVCERAIEFIYSVCVAYFPSALRHKTTLASKQPFAAAITSAGNLWGVSCHNANIWVRCEAIKRGIHLTELGTRAGNVQVEWSWQVWLWLVLHHGGVIQSCLSERGREVCSDLLSPLPHPLSLHLEWMKSGTTSLVFGSLILPPRLAHTHSCTTACPLCLCFHCTTTTSSQVQI